MKGRRFAFVVGFFMTLFGIEAVSMRQPTRVRPGAIEITDEDSVNIFPIKGRWL